MNDYAIRRADASDADVIAGHRVAMFRDMGEVASDALAAALRAAAASSLDTLLRNGAYVGWLATDAGRRIIAGAGVHIKEQLPRIAPDRTRIEVAAVPLVVNVYTEPDWRHRGVARALMQALMAWAADRGFDRVVLHASDDGRPLYTSLGFVATNEMRWSPTTEFSAGTTGSSRR